MIVVGLTGSIGMGKSTANAAFASLGARTWNADSEVHRLMSEGGAAVFPISKIFPKAFCDSQKGPYINRNILSKTIFQNSEALQRLEGILHPLVKKAQHNFLLAASLHRCSLVVLDVPLLFETRGDKRCDATVVVSAPHFIQRSRVLKRAGMTNEKFVSILNRQMSDQEKRRRADFIISTGQDKRVMLQSVRKIVQILGSNHKKFKTRLWYKQVR